MIDIDDVSENLAVTIPQNDNLHIHIYIYINKI